MRREVGVWLSACVEGVDCAAMLTTFRRHRKECEHRTKGRKYQRCRCPIWVDGFVGDREIRKSLGTRDWQKAQETVREWEATANEPNSESGLITISEACVKLEADAEARRVNEATVYKYKLLFRQLKDFSSRRGLKYLFELNVDVLGTFRAEWKDGPRSSLKKLERLRAFLHFAQRRKWILENPAHDLKAPKVSLCPTLPFTNDDMVRVLAAADKRTEECSANGKDNARRIRALILLMRYSGMRIGDVVSLTLDRISGNHLFLYTAKTGTPVNTVLPDFVIRVLDATPRITGQRYFWSGAGKLANSRSRVGDQAAQGLRPRKDSERPRAPIPGYVCCRAAARRRAYRARLRFARAFQCSRDGASLQPVGKVAPRAA